MLVPNTAAARGSVLNLPGTPFHVGSLSRRVVWEGCWSDVALHLLVAGGQWRPVELHDLEHMDSWAAATDVRWAVTSLRRCFHVSEALRAPSVKAAGLPCRPSPSLLYSIALVA